MSRAIRVHRQIDGSAGAPTIVFSNSLGASLAMWEPQVAALAAEYRLVRYDMRGHGASPVPPGPYALDDLVADLAALLDDVQISTAHLVGLSLGGMVSLAAAAAMPDRVASVTVLSSAAQFPNPDRYRERATIVRREGTAAIAADVVSRWLTPAFAESHPDVTQQLREMIAATPPEGYAACCEVVAAADVTPLLGEIQVPVLSIAAAEDRALPPSEPERIARLVANGRFAVVDGAAHLQNVERADRVDRLIEAQVSGRGFDEREVRERGMRARRAVLGDPHVDRAVAATTSFDAAFQDFITRTAWGDVWSRPGLDRRTRSIVTLAAVVALGAEGEIALHVRGALRNGLTPDEIAEILLHAAVYAGVPRANSAFAIARKVLTEEGLL